MAETTIICPGCGKPFELTAAMTATIEQDLRKRYDADAARKEQALAARERAVHAERAEVEKAKLEIDAAVAAGLATGQAKLVEQVKSMTRQETSTEVKLLKEQMAQQARALDAAVQRQETLDQQRRDAEGALRSEREVLAQAKAGIDSTVAERVQKERAQIATEEARKAKLTLESDLASKERQITDLGGVVKQLNAKLTTAQQAEADYRRKERELEDFKREAGLSVERQLGERAQAIANKARQESDDAHRLRIAEKDKLIEDQRKQLADAQRRLEQGSPQLHGEVQELHLEAVLRAACTHDVIKEVSAGERGADVIHRIVDGTCGPSGMILWESKRARTWNSAWIAKARQNQREAKADAVVIVTEVLPDGVDSFGDVDGVWVTSVDLVAPLAIVLRSGVIATAAARRASEGQQAKTEILYRYLTGPQFRQRVEAMMDGYRALKEDLESEKRAMLRRWAAREKQLEIVLQATTGMYGDLQGIAGKTLPEIEGMELKLLQPSRVPKEV